MKEWLRSLDRPLVRANELRDQHRWPEAAEAYRAIVRRRPGRAGAWMQLGHCLKHLGEIAEAAEAYRAADRARPGDAKILFHLAGTLYQLGDPPGAERLYARILQLNPDHPDILRAARLGAPQAGDRPLWLDHMILGTTGLCNASCVHCPTGKSSTASSPRTPMPMPLFRKIIDELADGKLKVAGNIAFGLFGDGLVDPFVVERARYLRERLPDAHLCINTNGAAYDPARHAELDRYASVVTIHCESLIPETYDYLMQPLRAERVHVKFPSIFRDFPGKVVVAVPVSRLNIDERPAIEDYFYGLGAINVDFAPIANRLAHDEDLFDRIAFAPVPIRCGSRVLHSLIVDCDGKVLACCNDFSRAEPVGDLSRESIAETIDNQQRRAFRDKLAGGCHSAIATCNRCRGDTYGTIPPREQKMQPAA